MTNDEKGSDARLGFSAEEYAPQKVIEQRLTNTHDLRHLSFRFMQDGFAIVNAKGLHVDVNPALCDMTGFSEAELIGADPMFCYWPPEASEEIRKTFERSLREETTDAELIFMRKNGERFPVLVNPFAIKDKRGQIVFFAATVKDVTQRVKLQLALQESEERFRRLFEGASEAIVILEGENIIDCNQRALELFDISSRDQLLSHAVFEFFPPTQSNGQDSRAFSIEKLKTSRLGKPQFFEWTHLKLDGTTINTEVSLSTLKVGEKYCTKAIIRDITQRKNMEEALRLSEQRYHTLFESAGDGILIMQGEHVLDCNDRVLELYGITREELMRRANYSLSPPCQPNGQDSQAYFAEKVAALRFRNPQIFQWSGNKLDGTPIETEVTLSTILLDGKPCTQSLIRDTTQRKQLENALRDSEVRFRTLFENAGDAISIMKDGRTLDCNKRLSDMYELSREEILTAPMGEFFPSTQPNGRDSREFFKEKVQASRSGTPQIYEWHGRKRDGTPIITEITLSTLVLGGEVYEQAIARDITQRKQMEATLIELNATLESRVKERTVELEKANADLLLRNTQFRALAAQLIQAEHEERKRIARYLHDNQQQLLIAAKFRAEMLQSDSYNADANDVGRTLVQILEQAIEMSRSLTMELAPPILYGAGLVVAIQWLARWMEEHHHLRVAVVGDLPVTPLPNDVSILVIQTVRELLLNVIKHAGVRKCRVTLALADQHLLLTVTDEGVGFDVAAALDSPRSFGLFGIQERLGLLDGRLEISSAPGRGTTSTLSVPVADPGGLSAIPELCSTQRASYVKQESPGYIRIVVVDDHAGARDGMVQVLGLVDDFAVVGQAVDGLDAIEKVGQLLPDVVLMDMSMPQLDGLAATRRITSEFPGVTVIGFSMHANEEVQTQWFEAGAACYLQKSAPVEELISAIRTAMQQPPTEVRWSPVL